MLLRRTPKGHPCSRCAAHFPSLWSKFSQRRLTNRCSGHYTALQATPNSPNSYSTNTELSITVTVEETFDNDHRLVNTKGSHTGKFTFSAADAGDHRICFTTSGTGGGWFGQQNGVVKLTLDLAIGETNAIKSSDEGKIGELAQKVRDLNGRLVDIRREQVFQRVRKIPYLYPFLQEWQGVF